MESNTDADAESATCAGTTTDGSPCGNPAGDDGYCWIPSHGPAEANDDPTEPETIRVTSDRLGYVAPGLRIEQRHAVHEVERTAAIDDALEQGRIRRVGERS